MSEGLTSFTSTASLQSNPENLFAYSHRYQPPRSERIGEEQEQQLKSVVREVAGLENQLLYGIEVAQAIQNLNHTVPAIADKPTLVRAYLKFQWPFNVKISGLLKASWRASDRAPFTVAQSVGSMDYLKVSANSTAPLKEQREDLQKSLNFILPDAVLHAGECHLQLLRIDVYLPQFGSSFKLPIYIAPGSVSVIKVEFQSMPPLRLQTLGIRYQDDQGNSYEPSGTDYALIQSWLKRAYPIAALEWSQRVVNSPQVWPFDASTINAFVRGIRRQDVENGVDARTHYYGLVSDGAGFMRGLASGVPDDPDPSTVASGPTGPNWSWDTDGSYGDWYTGHELGHTFGRYHAEFCGAGGGRPYPFENGQLSNADEEFVGIDFGDLSHNIPMRALPGIVWHDVMTYCDNQWLSSFTYTGIRERLIAEDSLALGTSRSVLADATPMLDSGSIHVLATVNLTRKSGKLQHVTASSKLRPDVPASVLSQAPDLKLRLYRKDGELIGEYLVHFYRDVCREENADETGIVDVVIPSDPQSSTLELVLNGQVIDTFTRTATANPVQNIRAATEPQERMMLSSPISDRRMIEWTDESAASGVRESAVSPKISYVVQISQDDGATWQTVGYDLDQTKLEIDSTLLEGIERVQVRVTSTDGFTAQTVTQTVRLT
jgi:hypothetical protein